MLSYRTVIGTPRWRSARAAPISGTDTCRRSATTRLPSMITSVTSAADAANTTFSTVAPPPAVRIDRVSTATRSAGAPTRSAPASVQPRARCPALVAASSKVVAEMIPRSRRASRSSSSTARASSNRSITAWLSEPRLKSPRPASSAARRADSVAEIALSGRTEAGARRRPVHIGDVLIGQVGGVHRRRARAENPVVAHERGRGAAVHREAFVDLRRLFGGVHVQGCFVCVGPVDDRGHLRRRHSAYGMYCRTDDHACDRTWTSELSRSTRSAHCAAVPSPNRCCGPFASGAPSMPDRR